jgi:hypothetical protein
MQNKMPFGILNGILIRIGADIAPTPFAPFIIFFKKADKITIPKKLATSFEGYL